MFAQSRSSQALNTLSDLEDTTDAGRAFLSLMVCTLNEFPWVRVMAVVLFNFHDVLTSVQRCS